MDFSKTRISLSRKPTDYSKVQWLIGQIVRGKEMFYPRVVAGSYLNVGCGPNIEPNFVNIDYSWRPGLDMCCDIRRGLPLPDAIVGGVYSEHCLEHLALADAKAFLADCHRVMRPGAYIRMVVPDLEMYARAYIADLEGQSIEMPNQQFGNRTGVNRPVAMINDLFYGSGHRFHYDFRTLAEVLGGAGFKSPTKRAFRLGEDPRLLVDDKFRACESLYVEAVRP
ncbi:MAG: methyltransferase domain-containing protein [Reyranella sp.]|nr:methyltransferase domain-containing protein [Reyranella sp.]